MIYNSIQICEPEQIGNDWGFYVDIELPHIHNNKHGFVTNKYSKNYYKCYDKIDEELEYYENEYNKKMEYEYNKNIEDENLKKDLNIINRKLYSSMLFSISSVTLITAALSYCFIAAL